MRSSYLTRWNRNMKSSIDEALDDELVSFAETGIYPIESSCIMASRWVDASMMPCTRRPLSSRAL